MSTIAFRWAVYRVLSPDLLDREMLGAWLLYNDLVAIERRRTLAKRAYWALVGGYVPLLAQQREAEALARDRSLDRAAHFAAKKVVRDSHYELDRAMREAMNAHARAHADPAVARRKDRAKQLRAEHKARGEALTDAALGELLDAEPDCVSERDRLRIELARDAAERGVKPSAKTITRLQREAGLRGPDDWIDVAANAAAYAAYTARGVTFGTRALVSEAIERAVKDAHPMPPSFRRERVASCGLSQLAHGGVKELYSGENTQLRIEPLPDIGRRQAGSRRSGRRALVRVRLGSGAHRAPIFCDVEVVINRPLPEGAIVLQARIKRETLGVRVQHFVVLTCVVPDAFTARARPAHAGGTVAVDLGWRSLGSGDVRVGYAVDSAGREHELTLPRVRPRQRAHAKFAREHPERGPLLGRVRHAQGLHSVIDRAFASDVGGTKTGALYELEAWLATHATCLPEWLAEATKGIGRWESKERLVRLVETWSSRRFGGDDEIYARLAQWRLTWRHLYGWAAQERAKAIRVRNNYFRELARSLAHAYDTIIVTDTDFAATKRRKRADETDRPVMVDDLSRAIAQFAAPGELREAIESEAKRFGTLVARRASNTLSCHACGALCVFDRAVELEHTCEHCGVRWDQDKNAAINMLRNTAPPPKAEAKRERRSDGETTAPARATKKREKSRTKQRLAGRDAAE